MQYKGGSKPLREIAKDLSLDAVVEGSLLRSGGGARPNHGAIDPSENRYTDMVPIL